MLLVFALLHNSTASTIIIIIIIMIKHLIYIAPFRVPNNTLFVSLGVFRVFSTDPELVGTTWLTFFDRKKSSFATN